MSLQNVDNIKPVQIANLQCLTFVTIQVKSAITVRFAANAQDLTRTGSLGDVDGIEVNNTILVAQFWWQGELWAMSNAPGAFVFLAPQIQPGSNIQR